MCSHVHVYVQLYTVMLCTFVVCACVCTHVHVYVHVCTCKWNCFNWTPWDRRAVSTEGVILSVSQSISYFLRCLVAIQEAEHCSSVHSAPSLYSSTNTHKMGLLTVHIQADSLGNRSDMRFIGLIMLLLNLVTA